MTSGSGVDIDRAWTVLTDVERIAPLLPGAQLQEVEGDEYRGIVKVKVGPITAQYKGVGHLHRARRASGTVVLEATGSDTRGQGNASATITATLKSDGDGTEVSVVTDLTITGKVAQFGRGVLAEVSGKLVTQFVDALEADLATTAAPAGDAGVAPEAAADTAAGAPLVGSVEGGSGTSGAAVASGLEEVLSGGPVGEGTTAALPEGESTSVSGAPPSPVAAATSSPAATAAPAATASATGAEPPATGAAPPVTIRRIHSPEPEPVDLLDAAGGSVAKRLAPLLGALGALVLVVWIRRRARR